MRLHFASVAARLNSIVGCHMRRARLIAPLPMARVDTSGGDGSTPQIGDIVDLDHGFAFPDGQAGGLVVCINEHGRIKWSADVLDSEIELLPSEPAPNNPLVPTRNGEAPLLAAQRRRWADRE